MLEREKNRDELFELLYSRRFNMMLRGVKIKRVPTIEDDRNLIYIIDVLNSCKRIDQLMLVRDWGVRLLAETPSLISIVDLRFDELFSKIKGA